MPNSDQFTLLRALRTIDDGAAAATAAPETHAELLEAIIATPSAAAARRPWSRRPSRRPLLLATALAAITATLLVATPGLLSGGRSATQPQSAQAEILHRITLALAKRPGTIVVERQTIRAWTTTDGRSTRPQTLPQTTITETAGNGTEQRVFSASASTPGFQQVMIGNQMQLYDRGTRTIYVTTQSAWMRETEKQALVHAPKGTHVSVGRMFLYGPQDAPGRTSVFEQELRQHLYKLGGHVTVDGRPALKLVPADRTVVVMSPKTGEHQTLGTVYVTPSSYVPIRDVLRYDGMTVITSWSLYRVLPDTPGNRWLVSLTARHPHARIVRGAAAYIAAQARQGRRR